MDGQSCDWSLKTRRVSPETWVSEVTVIHCPGGQQESKYVVISSACKTAMTENCPSIQLTSDHYQKDSAMDTDTSVLTIAAVER